MELLDKYFDIKQQIYQYFGFEENWTVYPINDDRKYYWRIDNSDVIMYDNIEAYENEDDSQTYSSYLLNSNQYPKNIYEGLEFTLVIIDTNTDGNIFLSILDNSKKIN